jgi:hypothetical protein
MYLETSYSMQSNFITECIQIIVPAFIDILVQPLNLKEGRQIFTKYFIVFFLIISLTKGREMRISYL